MSRVTTLFADKNELQILGDTFLRLFADVYMFFRRTVAGLTINAWLSPRCLVSVGTGVIICFELTDMARIACGVKRIFWIAPMKRFVVLFAGKMAQAVCA